MIIEKDGVFYLSTNNTSYWFRTTKFGHLEHLHYGERLAEQDPEPLAVKTTSLPGTCVTYDASDGLYCLDTLCLEWSGIGKGDYRHAPAELKLPDGSYTSDFVFRSFRIVPGPVPMETLPSAYGQEADCDTLEIALRDESNGAELLLYYTVYPETDVIARRAVLTNRSEKPLVIRRLMSLMVDLPNRNFRFVTFDGGWIREAHKHERALEYGRFVNESTTGNSSNRHNPGFLLAEEHASEQAGRVYGFNLVYSGNHYGAVERSSQELVRAQLGVSPHCFEWTLEQGGRFETPEAIMTFSAGGFNGLSAHFHDFVNRHIVRGNWRESERPVLANSWESCFFNFNRRKLLRLARQAKSLGCELFVLDDGWFGKRDDDTSSLGDYSVNKKKLPGGVAGLARDIGRLGLAFGLWFEPEMVNPNSELFRAHPEYAVRVPGKAPALGRNQLALDLCNPEVRDYIVASVSNILDGANVSYVKWDMNRHISDAFSPLLSNQGEFFHRYILGLYDVLNRVFSARPHILLESCASGGNRFDLGMLCFSPQVWASDDTDPVERLKIQGGLSYLYPLSSMGAHVSEAPHQQTLRRTALNTRFNAACFGCLGYEMDFRHLTKSERKEVRREIAFYKAHRRTFQYGRFRRFDATKSNKTHVLCSSADGAEAVAGFFQGQSEAAEGCDLLPLAGFDPAAHYTVETRPQPLYLSQFGGLVKHLLPVSLNPNGFFFRLLNRFYKLADCVETYAGRGDLLNHGLLLNSQFVGSYYNERTRLLGDFGSNLYVVRRQG